MASGGSSLGVLRACKQPQHFYEGPFFHFSRQFENEFTSLPGMAGRRVEEFDCSWNINAQRHLLNRHTARHAFRATEMLHIRQGKSMVETIKMIVKDSEVPFFSPDKLGYSFLFFSKASSVAKGLCIVCLSLSLLTAGASRESSSRYF